MVPPATFRELYDYNYWARDRQLKACAGLAPEQFVRPLGNSFSSVRDTLAHLAWAEWIWLERWQGRSPRRVPAANEFPTLESIAEYWSRVEQGVRGYLPSLTEEKLAQPLTYINLRGETWSYPLWRTLLHLVNHQTYHRGQITTMLRLLGASPPAVDFLVAHDLAFRA